MAILPAKLDNLIIWKCKTLFFLPSLSMLITPFGTTGTPMALFKGATFSEKGDPG